MVDESAISQFLGRKIKITYRIKDDFREVEGKLKIIEGNNLLLEYKKAVSHYFLIKFPSVLIIETLHERRIKDEQKG